jgi:hypothetical protein
MRAAPIVFRKTLRRAHCSTPAWARIGLLSRRHKTLLTFRPHNNTCFPPKYLLTRV